MTVLIVVMAVCLLCHRGVRIPPSPPETAETQYL